MLSIKLQGAGLPNKTRTALEAAHSIGCEMAQIVKSLIFKTAQTARPVLILAAGPNQVTEKQIAAEVGETITQADADFAKAITGVAIGGIPPIGHKKPIDFIFMDQALLNFSTVWAAAGTPNAVFEIQSKALLSLTNARLISLSS